MKLKYTLVFSIISFFITTTGFAQALSDQEIGFDVARTTTMLKEHGVKDQDLAREVGMLRDMKLREYVKTKKTEEDILLSIKSEQTVRTAKNSSAITTKTELIDIPETEKNALKALYDATNGANWKAWLGIPNSGGASELVSTSWDFSTPVTSWNQYTRTGWYGIVVENGHVVSIDLNRNNLINNGVDLPNLSGLGSLQVLNLTGNVYLEGSLNNIQYSVSLKYLNIAYTSFSQVLLPISKLTNLEYLEISHRTVGTTAFIDESIPDDFYNLNKLKYLNIGSHALKGGLSSKIGNLINLETLILYSGDYRSRFGGALPAELGSLINLKHLNFTLNSFIGEIPSSIGNLTKLETLYLGFNYNINGNIPASLGNLTSLNELWLQRNSLNGIIPSSLGSLLNLKKMYLFGNALEGAIPNSFGQLGQLESLYLHENLLTGEIPSSLTNLRYLKYLFLEKNKFRFIDFSQQFLDYAKNIQFLTYAPQFKTDKIENINFSNGESKTLTMCQDGRYISNVDTFQWFKDGVALTDDSIRNRSYTISGLSVANAGVYSCVSKHPIITNSAKPANQNLILEREPITLKLVNPCIDSYSPNRNGSINSPYPYGDWSGVILNKLTNLSFYSSSGSTRLSYQWSLFDSNNALVASGNQAIFPITLTLAGDYKVVLRVSDAMGCSSFERDLKTRESTPCIIPISDRGGYIINSAYSEKLLVNTATVLSLNRSSSYTTAGFTYKWDLVKQNGDLVFSGIDENFTVTPTEIGDYIVNLQIKDPNGCTTDYTTEYKVVDLCGFTADDEQFSIAIPGEYYSSDTSLVQINESKDFSITSYSGANSDNYTFKWSLFNPSGELVSTSTSTTFSSTFTIPGFYRIELELTNKTTGCKRLITKEIGCLIGNSCTELNPKSAMVKDLLKNLIKSLIMRSIKGETDAQINASSSSPEFLALKPYITNGIGNTIYNYKYSKNLGNSARPYSETIDFSFSPERSSDIHLDFYWGVSGYVDLTDEEIL
ncbi:leucine-rich repeat domain-containing protein, partial [Flavobacterium polysaccharolyticum]